MAKTVKRHKKSNKRSIAAKARWAKIKAANENKIIKTPRKGYSSPSDIVARMMDKDENWTTLDQLKSELNLSPQTRLDIIFHDLEQAVKEVIIKLKSMF